MKRLGPTALQIKQAKQQCLKDIEDLEKRKNEYGYTEIPLKWFRSKGFIDTILYKIDDCVKQSELIDIHNKFNDLLEWYKELSDM